VPRVPRIPNPIGAPAEIVNAVKLLPTIADRLGEVVQGLRSISADTRELPSMNERIGVVAAGTEVLPGMDARMQTIEQAMPALLEVQQHLAQLPETIQHLDGHIGRLTAIMDDLLSSLHRLDQDVNTLSASVEPLGRLAGRVPGGSKR
jgi:hypothetical protein